MSPLVSIIIPTYNRCSFLGETLDSVLRQTYPHWECIVVDDGSVDYTSELLEFYCSRDLRIKFVHRPEAIKKGASASRNLGLKISKGKYINWLDSDDLLGPSKLEDQTDLLREKDDMTISTCYWNSFLNTPNLQNIIELPAFKSFSNIKEFINSLALSGGFFPPHAYLMSRGIVEKAGNWNEDLTINQDGEFLSRIFLKATNIVFSTSAKAHYRTGNQNKVSDLSDSVKVAHAVYSWNLIEASFRIKFGEPTDLVRISKLYLRRRIALEHSKELMKYKNDLINPLNSDFQLSKYYKIILNKILRRWKKN